MKKLIVTDPVWICGSDLVSGTSDEKRKYMGYDTQQASSNQKNLPRAETLPGDKLWIEAKITHALTDFQSTGKEARLLQF
jgi:hypothetical protein